MVSEPPDIEEGQLGALGNFERIECQQVGGGDQVLFERGQEVHVCAGGEIGDCEEEVGHRWREGGGRGRGEEGRREESGNGRVNTCASARHVVILQLLCLSSTSINQTVDFRLVFEIPA